MTYNYEGEDMNDENCKPASSKMILLMGVLAQ